MSLFLLAIPKALAWIYNEVVLGLSRKVIRLISDHLYDSIMGWLVPVLKTLLYLTVQAVFLYHMARCSIVLAASTLVMGFFPKSLRVGITTLLLVIAAAFIEEPPVRFHICCISFYLYNASNA